MKFSDLDLDIPSKLSNDIRSKFIRASVKNNGKYQPHPAGIYLYKNIPQFNKIAIADYKFMENNNYQKIDILNNTFLDNITNDEMDEFIDLIEMEEIDWNKLYKYNEPYQLSKYPSILKEFQVSSVFDIAMVLSIIRPGSIKKYDTLKKAMKIKKKISKDIKYYDILKDTYGVPIFNEQYKEMGIDDGVYRYKKPHAIGYAYVLLIDFLKKSHKIKE